MHDAARSAPPPEPPVEPRPPLRVDPTGVAVAFCLGLAWALHAPRHGITAGAAVLLLMCAMPRRRTLLAAFLAGGLRVALVADPCPRALPTVFQGRPVVVQGTVCEPVVRTPDACRVVMEVREIACGSCWQRVSARVLVTMRSVDRHLTPVSWGREVVARGTLERPRSGDGFDYAAWLAERDIRDVIRLPSAAAITACGEGRLPLAFETAAGLRRQMEAGIEGSLSSDAAALVEAVTLAEARALPRETVGAFRETGTYHVLVTAGIHVALVISVSFAVLGWLGVGGARAALLTVPGVALFALVTGASPSMIRAALMGTLGLLAFAGGRITDGRRSLAVTVLIMSVVSPSLVAEPGFQLSVACVWGILVLRPAIARRLERLPSVVRVSVSVSLATQIAAAPLTALYFGEISLGGVVANPVVVPLCEGLLVGGLLLSGVGPLLHGGTGWPLPDRVLLPLVALLVGLVERGAGVVLSVVSHIRGWPLCSVQVPCPGVLEVVLAYAAMAAWASSGEASTAQGKLPSAADLEEEDGCESHAQRQPASSRACDAGDVWMHS